MGMLAAMKTPHWLAMVSAVVLFSFNGQQKASAQLPSLDKQPWMGHFGAYESRRVRVGLTAIGKITINPLDNKGDPIDMHHLVPVNFGIEETQPGGKVVMKRLQQDSLETTDVPTDELGKVTFSGKVTGGASFEATVEQQRGYILIGGRVLDPGTLKNPLRFVVNVGFSSMYHKVKKETKREISAYEKKIKKDAIRLKWTDGESEKKTLSEPVDAKSTEINGPGISEIELETGAYKDRKFTFNAAPNSSMTLSNKKPGPLHDGFTITWAADPVKDPEGKARFSFTVK